MFHANSISSLLRDGEKHLRPYFDSARLDAEVLLSFSLNKSRVYLYSWPDQMLKPAQVATYQRYIIRRSKGEPISYIIGTKEFWSLTFNVTKDTLIPRPETELAIEVALDLIDNDHHFHVIDLGTGSGNIAIILAMQRPKIRLTAIDSSIAALHVAATNAKMHQIRNIQFIQGNWCHPVLEKSADVVLSNPPYVATGDPHLFHGDVQFEPSSALVSGTDGLLDIDMILKQARFVLRSEGYLIIEHGYDQQTAVVDLFHQYGYTQIRLHNDLAGVPRVVSAKNT